MSNRPHEETWEDHGDCYVHRSPKDGGGVVARPHGKDEAKIIAQAPAMARLLMRLEWSGRQDYVGDGGYDCCPCCKGIAPENENLSDAVADLARGRSVVGHGADCELAAVLRAAGVLP